MEQGLIIVSHLYKGVCECVCGCVCVCVQSKYLPVRLYLRKVELSFLGFLATDGLCTHEVRSL